MSGEKRVCAYKDCKKEFTSSTHNQKYDTSECCRLATNAKIMERYHEKKERRAGGKRLCRKCASSLSRYNSSNVCGMCEAIKGSKQRLEILKALDVISSFA